MSALALAGASSVASAQGETDWSDVEGRIQYAYYTNDARALDSVLVSLRSKAVEGEAEPAAEIGARAYFRALAQYRVAQVLATTKKSQSKDAIDECEDEIDVAIAALPKIPIGLDESDAGRRQRAEIYTLSTACVIAGRELSSDAGESRIAEAARLEPRNPRVRLFEALVAHGDAGKDAAAKAAAITKLRAVIVMFEQARAAASTTPEWGAAEAYAYLGRALYEQRDIVGAREALERALLVAPEYAYARKLMGQITR
jgi:tetratricopeptide (TPR) repeat protein